MGLFSSKYKGFSLCAVDVFTKYAWFKPLQTKNVKTFLNVLIEIVSESNREPNKLWVDQGRYFTINLSKNRFTIIIF